MAQYPSFGTTLIQTKDLLCVVMTEVLRVVSPGDSSLLMRVITDLAAIEGEQMSQRRRDDVGGYIQLRDSIIKLLLTLQAMSASTDATPIIEDDEDQDVEGSETESDDEEAQLLLLGDTPAPKELVEEGATNKTATTQGYPREGKRSSETNGRGNQSRDEIWLYGIIPKEKRKKMKEKSGLMRGCFVVQENWDEMSAEQRALLDESEERPNIRKRWRRGRRKLIKWSNIQTDADIDAQSSTLAEAFTKYFSRFGRSVRLPWKTMVVGRTQTIRESIVCRSFIRNFLKWCASMRCATLSMCE